MRYLEDIKLISLEEALIYIIHPTYIIRSIYVTFSEQFTLHYKIVLFEFNIRLIYCHFFLFRLNQNVFNRGFLRII